MHKADRAKRVTKRGGAGENKVPVVGVIERGGKVRASVLDDVRGRTLRSYVHDAVEPGSSVYTDAFPSYNGLSRDYDHRTVDHMVTYVDGNVHTNFIENFWSLLKRGLNGTYISVEPFHLFRYLDERMFTFNERALTDSERFEKVIGQTSGLRLTYRTVTGKAS